MKSRQEGWAVRLAFLSKEIPRSELAVKPGGRPGWVGFG